MRVRNPVGSVDSNTATLTVLPWATLYPGVKSQGTALIGSDPQSQTVRAGDSATFVVISLWPSATYQWQVSSTGRSWSNVNNDGTYRGATSSALIVSAVSPRHEALRYRCIVTAGTVAQTSAEATLRLRR